MTMAELLERHEVSSQAGVALGPCEQHVLRHALMGACRVVHRNYFAAGPQHCAQPALQRLVANGLMVACGVEEDMTIYRCTAAGAAAVGVRLPWSGKESR